MRAKTQNRPYSVNDLHRLGRRLDRRTASANGVLAAMRQGQSLHLQYAGGRPLWSLSGGQIVSPETALLIIDSAAVRPAGGGLFSDLPGQVWEVRQ